MSRSASEQNSKVKAIIFDAYGTLFDTQSVKDALEGAFPGRGDYLTQVWRLKQLEYSWLRALSGDYKNFGEITRDALRYGLSTLGITIEPQELDKLADGYDALRLFPDVLPMLDGVSDLRLAIFSNGSPKMLSTLLGNVDINHRFEQIISVDEVRTFKPDPETYRLACTRLNLAPSDVLLVTSNGFDLHGGSFFGLRTARVARLPPDKLKTELSTKPIGPNEMYLALRSQMEQLSLQPDVSIATLLELPEAVRAL